MGEAHTKKHSELLHEVKIEVIIDTLACAEVSQIGKTWADTVIKVNTRTVGNTLLQLQGKEVINIPGDTLALTKVKKRRDTLGNVQVKALLKTLAKILAYTKVKTLAVDVETEALGDALLNTHG